MKQTFEAELMRCARTVTRLQNRKRRLRRDLKATEKDLRLERQHLKALASRNADREPDVMPSKVFGDSVGLKAVKPEWVEKPPVDEKPVLWDDEPTPEAVERERLYRLSKG